MDADKRKPRKKAGPILAMVLLLLPLAYVASSGPAAAWVVEPDQFSTFESRARTYNRVYAPLVAAEWRSGTVQSAMMEWRHLFLDQEGEQMFSVVHEFAS